MYVRRSIGGDIDNGKLDFSFQFLIFYIKSYIFTLCLELYFIALKIIEFEIKFMLFHDTQYGTASMFLFVDKFFNNINTCYTFTDSTATWQVVAT